MAQKTNKSVAKRISRSNPKGGAKTKKRIGKLMTMTPGQGKYKGKESRSKQLNRKRGGQLTLSQRDRNRCLPHS
jgi:hypothetical protein